METTPVHPCHRALSDDNDVGTCPGGIASGGSRNGEGEKTESVQVSEHFSRAIFLCPGDRLLSPGGLTSRTFLNQGLAEVLNSCRIFPAILAGKEREKDLFLFGGFFVMVDQFALIDTFPVLRQVFPVRSGFHDRVMLCTAHQAFHESCRFVNQLHHFFFLCHATNVGRICR
jgi:hypothetical protein